MRHPTFFRRQPPFGFGGSDSCSGFGGSDFCSGDDAGLGLDESEPNVAVPVRQDVCQVPGWGSASGWGSNPGQVQGQGEGQG